MNILACCFFLRKCLTGDTTAGSVKGDHDRGAARKVVACDTRLKKGAANAFKSCYLRDRSHEHGWKGAQRKRATRIRQVWVSFICSLPLGGTCYALRFR